MTFQFDTHSLDNATVAQLKLDMEALVAKAHAERPIPWKERIASMAEELSSEATQEHGICIYKEDLAKILSRNIVAHLERLDVADVMASAIENIAYYPSEERFDTTEAAGVIAQHLKAIFDL